MTAVLPVAGKRWVCVCVSASKIDSGRFRTGVPHEKPRGFGRAQVVCDTFAIIEKRIHRKSIHEKLPNVNKNTYMHAQKLVPNKLILLFVIVFGF